MSVQSPESSAEGAYPADGEVMDESMRAVFDDGEEDDGGDGDGGDRDDVFLAMLVCARCLAML